jgi:hypothetical protein
VSAETLKLTDPEKLGDTLPDRDAVDVEDADASKLKDDVGEPEELNEVEADVDNDEELEMLTLPVRDAAAEKDEELLRLTELVALGVSLSDKRRGRRRGRRRAVGEGRRGRSGGAARKRRSNRGR